jgi:hypothetical protein
MSYLLLGPRPRALSTYLVLTGCLRVPGRERLQNVDSFSISNLTGTCYLVPGTTRNVPAHEKRSLSTGTWYQQGVPGRFSQVLCTRGRLRASLSLSGAFPGSCGPRGPVSSYMHCLNEAGTEGAQLFKRRRKRKEEGGDFKLRIVYFCFNYKLLCFNSRLLSRVCSSSEPL